MYPTSISGDHRERESNKSKEKEGERGERGVVLVVEDHRGKGWLFYRELGVSVVLGLWLFPEKLERRKKTPSRSLPFFRCMQSS